MRVTDAQLHEHVLSALEAVPDVQGYEIGIAVSSGVVILSGYLDNDDQARAVECIVARVPGVVAVMQTARIGTAGQQGRRDTSIAHRVADVLAQRFSTLENRLVARVEHGWVTLEGEVDLAYERTDAEETICQLSGVRGVNNRLTVRPPETVARIRAKIDAALNRIPKPAALLTSDNGSPREMLVGQSAAAGDEQP